MDSEKLPPLTFALIDARITGLKAGPVATLDSPRWIVALNVIGLSGMVVALLPSLLLQWWTAELWMLWMARAGLAITVLAFTPGFLRSLWVIGRELRRGRGGFISQLDHDVSELQHLRQWLLRYPRAVLQEHRWFAGLAQQRLTAKLGLLIGGIDKFGLLPVLLSALVLLRNWRDLLALPSWLALLAMFPVILWGIGWIAGNFRLRLQLNAEVLSDALQAEASAEHASSDRAGAGGHPVTTGRATAIRQATSHG